MKYSLKGYNIDNLLKILHSKKVTIFNLVRPKQNHVEFEILDKDVAKCKKYIQNYKIKETLSKIKAFPSILLSRLGVIIGASLSLVFYLVFGNFTWQINIFGNDKIDQSEIIHLLKENGVSCGKIVSLTNKEIESILLNKYDRIAQVSVIRHGTAIIINLSEKLVYKETEYLPIKAKYSGIITDINLITGTVNVKVGDYVNIGDVLVLPFNLTADGGKVSVKPIAEIKGKIYITSIKKMERQEKVLQPTGRTIKEYHYKFRNKKLFSGKRKNSFDYFEVCMYNENISGLIPLNRDVFVYSEMQYVSVTRNFEKEKENLLASAINQAKSMLPTGEILNEKSFTFVQDNTLYATSQFTVQGIIND